MGEPAFQTLTEQEWVDLHNDPKVITASEVGTILDLNPYETPFDLWAKKTGKIEPFKGNTATEVGHQLEPYIASKYAEENPEHQVVDPGDFAVITHPDHPWLKATLDRWIVDFGPLELKHSQAADKSAWLHHDGPLQYQVQVLTQMACTQSEKAKLKALVGYDFYDYDFEFRDKLFKNIIPKLEAFIQMCVNDEAPDIDYNRASTIDTLKAMHPDDNGETIEFPEDFNADILIENYWKAKSIEEKAKKEQDRIKAIFMEALGDNSYGLTPDANKISFTTVNKKAYTVSEKKYRQLNMPRRTKGSK